MPNIRVTPSGIMDKDTDVSYVSQGNYIDANDIRHRQIDGQNFGGVMPVKGNSLSASVVNYAATSKVYRIYFDVTDIANGAVSANEGTLILKTNSNVYYTNASLNIATTTLATYASTLKGYLNTLANSAYGGNFTYPGVNPFEPTGTYSAYFDLSTALDTDFVLTVQNITAELCSIKVKTEYIATGGSFSVIGSKQLGDDLFVYSAGSLTNSDGSSQVSEIGVVYPSGAGYAYVTLLRSKKLTFFQTKIVDIDIEEINEFINFYWTDNSNPVRSMKLKKALKRTAGGFSFTEGGDYELDTINFESALFKGLENVYIDNIEVVEGLGRLTSGNKRYSGRFVMNDYSATEFIYPTNPINIYNAKTVKTSSIAGDDIGTITTKGIRLQVENFTPGIYSYFELAVIEFNGKAFNAKIVRRFKLGESQTNLKIEHTGVGDDNIVLSVGELLALKESYASAKNLRLFDNRLVLSNISQEKEFDLRDWASSINHSVHQKYISGLGGIGSLGTKGEPAYKYGEYQDPMNVMNYKGYMFNDTYRFGIQVKWKKTNKWSAPYYLDDIRFDSSTTNVVGGRRTMLGGTITSVNVGTNTITLTNHKFQEGDEVVVTVLTGLSGVTSGKVYHATSVTTNTFQLSDTYFTSPTVVSLGTSGTGSVVIATLDINLTTSDAAYAKAYYPRFHNINLDYSDAVKTNGTRISDLISSYKIVRAERIPEVLGTGLLFRSTTGAKTTGGTWFTPLGVFNNAIVVGGGSGTQKTFFYSPDFYFGREYVYQTGDQLKISYPFDRTNMVQASGTSRASVLSKYQDFPGYFYDRNSVALSFTTFNTVNGVELNAAGEYSNVVPGENWALNTDAGSGEVFGACYGFKLSSVIPALTAPLNANEYGHYYTQIFRDLSANKKYPANTENTTYYSTGHYYILLDGDNGVKNNISVFGGDVFNQKSHLKIQSTRYNNTTTPTGQSSGWSFYSQNVLNTQMFNYVEWDGNDEEGAGYAFPQYVNPKAGGTYGQGTIGSKAIYWLEVPFEASNQNNYDDGYTPSNILFGELGYFYDNNLTDYRFPSRIVWSSKKTIGSAKNNFMIFQPTSFTDLDLAQGEISHHDIINNNFYTWQEFSFQRQYFREPSLLNGQTGSDIVIGSGSILSSSGEEISNIGTSKKTSIVVGKNPSGKQTVYWYNDRLQKIVRFGQDGTRVISDKGVMTYLLNNGKYISNEFFPLTAKGVLGVWNDKYSEAIFTIKYNDGVSNKQFTLVFDEIKNGFVGFHSYTPNIYLPYNNGFFSTNPASQKDMYLHDSGSDSTYYTVYTIPSLTAVMNYEPNISKNFEALQFVTDTQPYDVYLTTTNHVSYLDETEFEKREDLWYSPIKNDSTSSGINSGDTSRLWGKWLKVKMTFEASSGKQKLINFIVKFRAMARLYNQ